MHIDFYERPHWKVSYLECSRYFVSSLPDLVGVGATLYLESYKSRDELRPFLVRHRIPTKLIESVALAGARRPVWTEHLSVSRDLVADFELLYAEWYHTPAEHVHCYAQGRTLFWFHDAFTGGELQIAPQISQAKVAQFCRGVAPRHHFVPQKEFPVG